MVAAHSPPPLQATPLLGRALELQTIEQRLIHDGVRLLSLTGPAGVGKTRLALEAWVRLEDRVPDGIILVDLAPVREPGMVVPTVAQAFGLTDLGPRSLLERLEEYLHERDLLIVLDNFEHVLSAAGEIFDLLSVASHIKLLVTSRIPLRLRWEQTLRIVPLAVPDLDSTLSLEDLMQVPSVALFVDRAKAQRADFRPTEAQAPLLVQLARQLDGLPLAIELAAANMNVLPLATIARRLEQHARTLHWDAQDLPPRQRSLHAALEWSYELLSDEEQRLFRHLGVFLRQVSLDAIAAILGDGDEEQTFGGLAALAEKSLVLPRQPEDEDPEPSFGMLETVREYAWEQLERHEELEHARRAHAQYFVELAEQAEPRLRQGGQIAWYRRLASEHDNLSAALRWLRDHEEHEEALRLAGALGYFWWTRGYNAHGWQVLNEALARSATVAPMIRIRGLNALAIHLLSSGDLERARPLLEEALQLSRSHNDWSRVAQCLTGLGLVAQRRGEWEESARRLDDALHHADASNDAAGMAFGLVHRGITALYAGDEGAAEWFLGGAEAAYTSLLDDRNTFTTRAWLAYLAGRRGDLVRASQLLHACIEFATQADDTRLLFHCTSITLWLLAQVGDAERLARLLGAYVALLQRTGFTPSASSQDRSSTAASAVQSRLTPGAFDSALAAGQLLSDARIAALAIDVLISTPQVMSDEVPRRESFAHNVLSRREQEILRLVAMGLTSKQIGKQLFLSHRTVDHHLTSAFNKLGVESRAQAVAVTTRVGLL
ncbi:MAG TPA: LuxR C-terminal-related transcriptional regulator [Chloroflexota bacterium]